MKRLPLLVALIVGITGMGVVVPAAADQGDGNATIPLGSEAKGPSTDRLSMPLFNEGSIVPGDSGKRTLTVRNDGPVDGVLTASIVNVELGGEPADPFYDELLLNGQPVSEYEHRRTAVLTAALDRGERTTVDLFYDFPEDSVSGNNPDAGMKVSFDVVLHIQEPTPIGVGERPDVDPQHGVRPVGESTEQGGQESVVAFQGSGDDDGAGRQHDTDDGGGSPAASEDGLAYTGTDLMWVVGAGLGLAILGALMMLVRRRSEDATS